MAGKRLVMVAVDASKHSEHAFEWFCGNVYKEGDDLILFHCHEPLDVPTDPYSSHSPEWAEKQKTHKEKMEQVIDMYKSNCMAKGISAKIKIDCHKKPGDRICHYAHEENVALIVIGSRGMSAIRRALLGGVSDHVAHHAKRPVVIVPAE